MRSDGLLLVRWHKTLKVFDRVKHSLGSAVPADGFFVDTVSLADRMSLPQRARGERSVMLQHLRQLFGVVGFANKLTLLLTIHSGVTASTLAVASIIGIAG